MTRQQIDTSGLAAAGLWIRRQRGAPALTDEALSLAQVLQTWNLGQAMQLDRYQVSYAEVSSPDLQPTWVYLVELLGRRADAGAGLFLSHPLSQVAQEEAVRIVALVQPPDFLIPGALVETAERRRMLWLQAALVR